MIFWTPTRATCNESVHEDLYAGDNSLNSKYQHLMQLITMKEWALATLFPWTMACKFVWRAMDPLPGMYL